jgi:hypothetical protein
MAPSCRWTLGSKRLARRLLLAACAAALPQWGAAADWALRLQTDRHSDFSSITDLSHDVTAGYRARSGRNLAYVEDEARLQRSEGPWTFSVLARTNATLIGNRDAIDALRHARGIDRSAADRSWQVDARLRGFAGAGVELAHGSELGPEWRGAVLVQALALTRWRDRRVGGGADFEAATSTYSFDLRSSEVNNRLQFPFQQGAGAHGAALLFGGDLAWQRSAWSASAGVRDLGWLHWSGVPQQDYVLSTSTRAIDAEGFVVYRPLLRGQNSQAGLTRSAPPSWRLAAAWQVTPDGAARLRLRRYQGFGWLPTVAWSQRWGGWETQASWDIHQRRVTLEAGRGNWQLRLGADRLDGGAHSRLLGVSYSTPL